MPDPPVSPGRPPRIKAVKPHVVEPTERKTFDKWAINGISTTGTGLGTDTARGHIAIIRYREVNGGVELAPETADRINLGDIYQQAENPEYADLKAALIALHAFAEKRMADTGIL